MIININSLIFFKKISARLNIVCELGSQDLPLFAPLGGQEGPKKDHIIFERSLTPSIRYQISDSKCQSFLHTYYQVIQKI